MNKLVKKTIPTQHSEGSFQKYFPPYLPSNHYSHLPLTMAQESLKNRSVMGQIRYLVRLEIVQWLALKLYWIHLLMNDLVGQTSHTVSNSHFRQFGHYLWTVGKNSCNVFQTSSDCNNKCLLTFFAFVFFSEKSQTV